MISNADIAADINRSRPHPDRRADGTRRTVKSAIYGIDIEYSCMHGYWSQSTDSYEDLRKKILQVGPGAILPSSGSRTYTISAQLEPHIGKAFEHYCAQHNESVQVSLVRMIEDLLSRQRINPDDFKLS